MKPCTGASENRRALRALCLRQDDLRLLRVALVQREFRADHLHDLALRLLGERFGSLARRDGRGLEHLALDQLPLVDRVRRLLDDVAVDAALADVYKRQEAK